MASSSSSPSGCAYFVFLHVCNKDIYFIFSFLLEKNKFKLLFLVVVLPSIAREVQSTSPKVPPQNACTEVVVKHRL